MSLEEQIHELVLGLDGVATVYAADPLWLAVAKQVGALLSAGDEAAAVPFVVCDVNKGGDDAGSGGRPVLTVRIRIGSDGGVPAPALARGVAAAIRAFVAAEHPETGVVVAVEIAAIGIQPPNPTAGAVVAAS
jgi:hypothetical protein